MRRKYNAARWMVKRGASRDLSRYRVSVVKGRGEGGHVEDTPHRCITVHGVSKGGREGGGEKTEMDGQMMGVGAEGDSFLDGEKHVTLLSIYLSRILCYVPVDTVL
jgi:hypothetical protein